MKFFACLALLLSVYGVSANKKCSGNPLRYNGKLCASTTRYHDAHKGACGCGDAHGDSQFGWNAAGFVVAANQRYFDRHHKGWCGEHCGQCIRLTTTGGWVDGQGGPSPAGHSKVFMVTNLCPAVPPNMAWCAQSDGNPHNNYGYEVHFDLENGQNQISGMGWNNPEVTFEVVNCDQGHREDHRSPSYGQWGQCQCAHQGKRLASNFSTSDNRPPHMLYYKD